MGAFLGIGVARAARTARDPLSVLALHSFALFRVLKLQVSLRVGSSDVRLRFEAKWMLKVR